MGTESQEAMDAKVKQALCGGFNEDGRGDSNVVQPSPPPEACSLEPEAFPENASLQRRVLREVGRLRPIVETMMAMRLAAGEITAEQVKHFVQDRDVTRAICGRARRMLDATPPPRPVMIAGGFWTWLLGGIGIETGAGRPYRVRLAEYKEEMRWWRQRRLRCQLPHEKDPPAMRAMDTRNAMNAPTDPTGMNAQRAKPQAVDPLVKLGPGGDFVRRIDPADLQA